jgi:hypothetical protein
MLKNGTGTTPLVFGFADIYLSRQTRERVAIGSETAKSAQRHLLWHATKANLL